MAILWDQFSSTMTVILIVAALASALLGDYEDSIAIAVIVVLNAALGFVQEYRAEKAMAALKRLSAPRMKVRREDRVREVSARELVPGDVVLLETGNLVPADGRLLEGANLRVQEAALTGASEPVGKDPAPLEDCFRAIGDPVEGGPRGGRRPGGHEEARNRGRAPRVGEVPFDSGRKRMTTVHRVVSDSKIPEVLEPVLKREGTPYIAISKGAIDSLLEISSEVWTGNGQAEPLDEEWQERTSEANVRLAGKGIRVLAMGLRRLWSFGGAGEELEDGLTFLGMVGMIDPPRSEAKNAVETCKRAGIRPVMITGDYPLTARYIATELGIAQEERILRSDQG